MYALQTIMLLRRIVIFTGIVLAFAKVGRDGLSGMHCNNVNFLFLLYNFQDYLQMKRLEKNGASGLERQMVYVGKIFLIPILEFVAITLNVQILDLKR